MNIKVLYIAREPQKILSGGASVEKRNLSTLQSLYGDSNVIVEYLPRANLRRAALSLATLSSYGVSRKQEKLILQSQERYECKLVFIEGSLWGHIVYELSKRGCKVVVHMHNIETELYKDRLKKEKGIVSHIRYYFVKFNERLSVRHASSIITLNQRDYDDMLNIYGRKADIILPITFPERKIQYSLDEIGNFLLFVGSDFFPNIEGIIWFIKNVAKNIKIKIKIVGGCCKNTLLKDMVLPENVELIGYVDDLDYYYSKAAAVIAPIFKGSGMKTKTIEAMSYGKTIIGTGEAFVGIENKANSIGFICNTTDEFIRAISNFDRKLVNPYTLKSFKTSFTNNVFKNKLELFLNNIVSV